MQIDDATTAVAAAAVGARQAQTLMAVQMAAVKQMAEMQQAMVELLRSQGIGNAVDVRA
jgi:hypothetical protein